MDSLNWHVEVNKALGVHNYDTASTICSKMSKNENALVARLATILTRFIQCEKSYSNLGFVKAKRPSRRDDQPLSSSYRLIHHELVGLRMELSNDDTELADEIDALIRCAQVRQQQIKIWRELHEISMLDKAETVMDDILLAGEWQDVIEQASSTLSTFAVAVRCELRTLFHCLKARDAIKDFDLTEAIIHLHQAKAVLREWVHACETSMVPESSSVKSLDMKESPWGSLRLFGSAERLPQRGKQNKRGAYISRMQTWLRRYNENLNSRLALYFMPILLEHEISINDGDDKSLWKGVTTDYHDMFRSFRKRSGAHSISLIYEVLEGTAFDARGLKSEPESYEKPTGLNSFPIIYAEPEAPTEHLPNAVSIIHGSRDKLKSPGSGPLHVYAPRKIVDPERPKHIQKIDFTYYLSAIDEHVTILIVYLAEHTSPDTHVVDFITNISRKLSDADVLRELIKP